MLKYLFLITGCSVTYASAYAQLITYPAHQISYRSPDYEVSIVHDGKTHPSFSTYGFAKEQYPVYKDDGTFMQFQKGHTEDLASHSSTIVSFKGKIQVHIKVLEGAKHISLPLKSAKVLPSSYNIPCHIENGNTIIFEMSKPQKVIVIANYDTVWNYYRNIAQGHLPVSNWREYYDQKENENYKADVLPNFEGYRNPYIFIGHELESKQEIPDKATAFVVKPGQKLTQDDFDQNKIIWFEPGEHDLTEIGKSPANQVKLKEGTILYLAGGSCVYGRFKGIQENSDEKIRIIGRGIISGRGLKWLKNHGLGTAIHEVDLVKGITVTDRSCFGIHQHQKGGLVEDVAMIGSWHANTMSVDVGDGAKVINSLLVAGDDDLKLTGGGYAEGCVIWEGANAHPIMVQENRDDDFDNTTVKDCDIIAYWKRPPSQGTLTSWNEWFVLSSGAIACVRGGRNSTISNFSFEDIRIESPFLYRVFVVYNLNTNKVNPGWFRPTSDNAFTTVDGMTFKNISVTSPIICFESLIGAEYPNSIFNINFENIKINGEKVNQAKFEKYFELYGKVDSQEINIK